MAHELYTDRAGKTSMAFVGQTPWHGLGQQLTRGATIEDWTREAGFNWEALTAPVSFVRADGSIGRMGEKMVIYRSDTGAPLSVMGDGYKIVQPREVIEFFRGLAASDGFTLHTAGIMRGGRSMWALASNHTESEVVPGDRVRCNLLLCTSLDGTLATTAGCTSVRVVCANTLAEALGAGLKDAQGRNIKGKTSGARITHRSVFDADAVKEEIGLCRSTFARFVADAQALAARPVGMEEARELLRGVFGQPVMSRKAPDPAAMAAAALAKAAGSAAASLIDTREQKSVARALELFAGQARGADHPGVKGTRWGLLNAVTEYVDHEQGRTADSRLSSAWFGRGADFKAATFQALMTA